MEKKFIYSKEENLWQIMPKNDIKRHTSGVQCECNPKKEVYKGKTTLVHNPFDFIYEDNTGSSIEWDEEESATVFSGYIKGKVGMIAVGDSISEMKENFIDILELNGLKVYDIECEFTESFKKNNEEKHKAKNKR